MTSNEPGEQPTPGDPAETGSRRLAQAPSSRYAPRPRDRDAPAAATASALTGPLVRADLAAALGAAALVFVGAILASTFGLLFVGAVMGAAIGLLLARAAVPAPGAGLQPVRRSLVVRLAIAIALVAVVVADVATWLYARGEGGTLGLLDYLWATFGPFVPGVAVIAAVAAAWGASAGPVQR